MSISTIVVGGNNVTLVAMPTSPGLRSVEFSMKDTVGIVTSPFTGQVQTQTWPGADLLTGTLTLPALCKQDAGNWIAFLMQLRGMANAFQVGDPLFATPNGQPYGSYPVVNNSLNGGNLPMSQSIGTSGWQVSTTGLLLPGDYIQVGVRLHRVLDSVNSDGSGNATFGIWPSLRETPVNGSPAVMNNAQGLFRLSSNQRKFSFDITQLTHLSIPIQEWR